MSDKIEKILNDFFKSFKTVNPFLIAEYMDIDVRYENLGNIEGYYTTILEDKIILINYNLIESNKRFLVCAHELFHAYAHHEISSYYTVGEKQRSKMENEANEFAFHLVCKLFEEEHGRKPSGFERLKNYYGLPESSRKYSE